MNRPKTEYRTVSTHDLKGLREAERLLNSGWKIDPSFRSLQRVRFIKSNVMMKNPVLSQEARELALFITNDHDLYRQQTLPIINNLAKKLKKGVYDPAKAVKLWRYLADNGAKKYSAEYGDPQPGISRSSWMRYKGYGIFTVKIRDEVARDLADTFMEAIIDTAKVPVVVVKA